MSRYFAMTVLAGAALWVFPVLVSVKGGLTRMPHESGLDMLVAAAVNLHHFLLDGVIWKLRDAPVRQALLESKTVPIVDTPRFTKMTYARAFVVAAGLIGVFCWILAAWEQEMGRRQSVANGDFLRLEMAAKRLAMVGRDGPRIHQALGKILQSRGQSDAALAQYRKSIDLWPTVPAWLGIGKIHEKEGNLDAALVAYQSALAIDPKHASALDDLAHVMVAQGDLDAAIRIQHRAILAAPERQDLRRRYDAMVVKLPIPNEDEVGGVQVDVYDAGITDSAR
jgi:tetratricopeptide (TPR) repeat protein